MVDLGAVLHEEALDAGELVLLRREHDDVELQVGQVGTGQLEARGVVRVLDVYRRRELVGDALLQGLDRLAVVVGLAGGVVVGRHALNFQVVPVPARGSERGVRPAGGDSLHDCSAFRK